MLPEENFDPRTGETNRVDNGWKRWIRGYKKKFASNTFDVLYSLAALATAGLGSGPVARACMRRSASGILRRSLAPILPDRGVSLGIE
jgi:hypothetical protein